MTRTWSSGDARLRAGATAAGFTLDVELTVAAGEVVALLGPNGAGKTTALRALAGLISLDAGQIRLGGELLDGPPEHRPVGVVFQDYLLFPHLSALENVAFGLRCQVCIGAGHGPTRRSCWSGSASPNWPG